ncbi:DUF485 domain-containing protein [Kocuria palustris]|uniref:DUF485 domain-containing protein n=1 Tax=Kocuria palustris TaxID=71999 RepID=UPI0011A0FD21
MAAQASPEFQSLRSTHRRFVFPMTVFFLAWFMLYVLLSIYAPSLMAREVIGNVNLGVILGLLQFVTTFGITALYVLFANKNLDRQAQAIRADLEAGDYAALSRGAGQEG